MNDLSKELAVLDASIKQVQYEMGRTIVHQHNEIVALKKELEEKTPKSMSRAGDEGDTKAWREACDKADGMRQCLLIQPDVMRHVCDHIDMLKEQIRVADVAFQNLHNESQKPIRVMLDIEGGNLQYIAATTPVRIYRVDWDNIEAGDELTDDFEEPDEIVSETEFNSKLQDCISQAKEKQK